MFRFFHSPIVIPANTQTASMVITFPVVLDSFFDVSSSMTIDSVSSPTVPHRFGKMVTNGSYASLFPPLSQERLRFQLTFVLEQERKLQSGDYVSLKPMISGITHGVSVLLHRHKIPFRKFRWRDPWETWSIFSKQGQVVRHVETLINDVDTVVSRTRSDTRVTFSVPFSFPGGN